MKVSELINELTKLRDKEGELDVKFEDPTGYRFYIDWVKLEENGFTGSSPETKEIVIA